MATTIPSLCLVLLVILYTTIIVRGADTESDAIGNHLPPSVHKIEFPKFDGTGDPMVWLNHCEHYFALHGTPKHQRVQYASFYLLDDTQLWYHRLELNGGPPSWLHFIQLVHTRFGPPLTERPIGELALLHRDRSIDAFCNRFMALSYRDPGITEMHQVQLFMSGLN
jgi:hypothetical protein